MVIPEIPEYSNRMTRMTTTIRRITARRRRARSGRPGRARRRVARRRSARRTRARRTATLSSTTRRWSTPAPRSAAGSARRRSRLPRRRSQPHQVR